MNQVPPRRPGPITDDHGQPIAPRHYGREPISPGGGPNLVVLITIIVVAAFVGMPILLNLGAGGATAFLGLVAVVAVIVFLVRNIVVVSQANAYVIERLGKYKTTWTAGLHLKIPFFDRIASRVSLKEQVLDFEPQAVITSDNVSIKIDSVVYLTITDANLVTYGVSDAIPAVENLTATTLRNIIGGMSLEDVLTSRDQINDQMQTLLDVATDPWGIKVSRVELKNIMPPRDIQEAMEKQMRAEREKREKILLAEGAKEAAILEATGQKEAMLLQAEAEKQRTVMQAEAERQATIARAEGEAQALERMRQAEAAGIAALNEAKPDPAVLQLRSMETLRFLGEGQATTVFVPSDLAGAVGALATVVPAVKQVKKAASDT